MKRAEELAPNDNTAQELFHNLAETKSGHDIPTKKEMTPDGARKRIIGSWIFTGVIGIIILLETISTFSHSNINQNDIQRLKNNPIGVVVGIVLNFFMIWTLYWAILALPSSFKSIFFIIAGAIGLSVATAAEMPKTYSITPSGAGGYSGSEDYAKNWSYTIPLYLIVLIAAFFLVVIVSYFYGLHHLWKAIKTASPWDKRYTLFTLIPMTSIIIVTLAMIIITPSSIGQAAPQTISSQATSQISSPSQLKIERFETFREGDMVFFRLFYTDPNNNAEGFGFRGTKGSLWAEETPIVLIYDT